MIIVASASSDTYITNKIIDSLSAVSGNVGRAGTLDLFKLYNESTVVTGAIELSRILVKFDLAKAKLLSSSTLDISDPTFKASLKLKNLSTGQPVPNNFTVTVFPLAVSFDEGYGRDVISFADVDACNYLSRSIDTTWNQAGASKSGTLGDSNVDYYVSGNLQNGSGVVSLASTQVFTEGTADISLDVTRIVSATIAGILPDNGFRLSFIKQQELDSTTRFVKRLASRHVRQQSLRPTMLVSCDDSIVDNRSSSYFDTTSSLYVHNILRGDYANFVSGSSFTQITGSNSFLVRFSTGSYKKYVTGSQVNIASFLTGVYQADVAIFSGDTSVITGALNIRDSLAASGSITFDEVWTSLDRSVTYFSGSLVMKKIHPSTVSSGVRKIRSSMLSTPTTAQRGQRIKLKTVFYDDYENNKSAKFAYDPTPLEIAECRVRIRDQSTGQLIFDFNEAGSKMSRDSFSNYFDLHTDALPIGVPLSFEYQIVTAGETLQVSSKNFTLILSE